MAYCLLVTQFHNDPKRRAVRRITAHLVDDILDLEVKEIFACARPECPQVGLVDSMYALGHLFKGTSALVPLCGDHAKDLALHGGIYTNLRSAMSQRVTDMRRKEFLRERARTPTNVSKS